MDKKTVYIETSIISYLTARPSRDLLAAAWQKVTIDWWETQRDRFDLYTSDIVIEEAGRGDDSVVSRRLEALAGIPPLEITDEVVALSEALIDAKTPKRLWAIPSISHCLPCMGWIIFSPGTTVILTMPKQRDGVGPR